MLERQVNYNRLLAVEVAALQNELVGLRSQVSELRKQVASLKGETAAEQPVSKGDPNGEKSQQEKRSQQ
jgi:hypothetical protein